MRTALATALVALLSGAVALATEPTPGPSAEELSKQMLELHKQAFNENSPSKYEAAHALYQQYLGRYADTPDATYSFYDAELLYNLQRYDEAAQMYQRAVTLAPHGAFAKDAAYALVVTTMNVVKNDGGAHCGAPPAVCELSPEMKRLVDAFDLYLALVDKSEERANIEYRRTRVYYEHNQWQKAAPMFHAIVEAYPDTQLATYSAELERECLATARRYDGKKLKKTIRASR